MKPETGPTTVSIFCDKVIEVGCMAIAVIVPLFFNVYSYRSFEPDKIALMRSVALVMALAWVIKMLESRNRTLIASLRFAVCTTPLALPALLLAVAYIIATITSIMPRSSLCGSYHRLQGTYTTVSYIAIFLLTLHTVRTRKQLNRLITIILITSLPISVYGIMQHYGLDPITWSNVGDGVTYRVISTMGNPIFLAAYLIMAAPLTMGRLVQVVSTMPRPRNRAISLYTSAACHILLLASQLLCVFFTQSRGPFLALVGGMVFFFLLLAACRGETKLALAVLGTAALLGLFLIALNLPHTPLEPIRKTPYVGRMSGVLALESRTVRQRILAWQGAVDLIAANPIRALVGYGPESMGMALSPYLPPDLASLLPDTTFDRAHNEIWDTLATTGVVGLGAYLLLFGSIFYHGLKWVGLIESPCHRRLFIALCLVGGVAGGLLPWLLDSSWRFAGVGIPAGVLVGLAIYLITYILHPQRRTTPGDLDLILVSLFSAVVAHFIETQFGIAVAATRSYFWIYAALMLIVGSSLEKEPLLEDSELAISWAKDPNRHGRCWRRSERNQTRTARRQLSLMPRTQHATLILHSLLVGLILATMGLAFVGSQANVWRQSLALLGLFLAVWIIGSMISFVQAQEEIGLTADSMERAPLLISASWGLIFIIAHTFVAPLGATELFLSYCLYLLLTVLIGATVLLRSVPIPLPFWQGTHWWLYPVLIVGTAILIVSINLSPIRADIYYQQGLAYANGGHWDEGIALFQRALALTPGTDFYYPFLAGACVEKAKAAWDASERSVWLEEARKALEQGREINPLNPDHIVALGLLHRAWGEMLTDPKQKDKQFNKALEYYRQAESLRPHSARLFAEWGLVLHTKGEYDEAIERHRRSLSLDDSSPQTYLLLGDTYGATQDLAGAMEAYEQAVRIAPEDLPSRRNLAIVYEEMARMEQAFAEAEMARSLTAADEVGSPEEPIVHLESEKR